MLLLTEPSAWSDTVKTLASFLNNSKKMGIMWIEVLFPMSKIGLQPKGPIRPNSTQFSEPAAMVVSEMFSKAHL